MSAFITKMERYVKNNLPEVILVTVFFFLYTYFVIQSSLHWKEAITVFGDNADLVAKEAFVNSELYPKHIQRAEMLETLTPVVAYIFLGALYVVLTRKKYQWIGMLCTILVLIPLLGVFLFPLGMPNYLDVLYCIYRRRKLVIAVIFAGLLSSVCLTMRERKRIKAKQNSLEE